MKVQPSNWITFSLALIGSIVAILGAALLLNLSGDCAPSVTNCGETGRRASFVVLAFGFVWIAYLISTFRRAGNPSMRKSFAPLRSTPLRLAARVAALIFISLAAVVTFGAVLGFPVFPSNIDNSRKSEVVGCYFIGNDLVAKIDFNRITSGRLSSSYDLISDNRGLAILPAVLLQAKLSGSTWQVVNAKGQPLLLPYAANGQPALSFTSEQGNDVVAVKGTCADLSILEDR